MAEAVKSGKQAKPVKDFIRETLSVCKKKDSNDGIATVLSIRSRVTKHSYGDVSMFNVDSCSAAFAPATVTVYAANGFER